MMNTSQFLEDLDRLERGQELPLTADDEYQADLAMARLLLENRSEPSSAHTQQLRSRLLRKIDTQEISTMSKDNLFASLFHNRFVKPLALGVTVLLILIIPLIVSPAIRVAAAEFFTFKFTEVDDLDVEILPKPSQAAASGGDENEEISILVSRSTVNTDIQTPPGAPVDEENRTFAYDSVYLAAPAAETGEGEDPSTSQDNRLMMIDKRPQDLTLEEAQKFVDFPIRQPSFVPEGYRFDHANVPDVYVEYDPVTNERDVKLENMPVLLFLHYSTDDGRKFIIEQEKDTSETDVVKESLVGKGSVEEVQINGQNAQLMKGVWKADGTWDATSSKRILSWFIDGIHFTINSSDLAPDEMIQIAEAIE